MEYWIQDITPTQSLLCLCCDCVLFQVSQVGDVLRALGQNPTEGDVKKLVQTTKVSWTLYTTV